MPVEFSTAVRMAMSSVEPVWGEQCNTFIYHRHNVTAEVVKVDAVAGSQEVVFTLDSLCNAFAHLDPKVSLDADKCRRLLIQPCSDGFRVTHEGDTWLFEPASGSCTRERSIDTKTPDALSKSPASSKGITIRVVNNTSTPLVLNWIDFEGNSKQYSDVAPTRSITQHTYEGHVWTLVSCANEAVLKKFVAQKSQPTVLADDSAPADIICDTPETPKDGIRIIRTDKSTWKLSAAPTEGYQWSENVDKCSKGDMVVAWEWKPAQDHVLHLIESSPEDGLEPTLQTSQYLKPGDNLRVTRPRVFSRDSGTEIPLDTSMFDNPYKVDKLEWNKAGDEFHFIYNQRGHQIVRVIGLSRNGSRVIIEEKSKTFIDYSSKLYYYSLTDTNESIWTSERDGWNRLYLVDMVSGKTQAITPSGQVVYRVNRVDEGARKLWYTAYGVVKDEDPYHQHLIRVNFDGTGYRQLTDGDGSHEWSWSPDKRWLVDTWSRVDMAPKTVLRDGETGELKMILETGDMTQLVGTGWTVPERFSAKGRNEKHLIYGIIIKPREFSTEKSYPIIEHIYAGPGDIHTPKKFGIMTAYHELADQGYIVIIIDGMGTNWRGKEFHDVCHKNLKDAGFPDRIAWLKAAARERPWMDISRVGIYGGSAGAQNAMGALLFHNDFYKVAIADCGCHDNRMDKLWWNEQWMGWPVDESYEANSNAVNAHRLEGHLMLILSELDENVDPSSTMQVVKALNDAEKDYEFLFFPGLGHCQGSHTSYGKRRMREFFRKHLLLSQS